MIDTLEFDTAECNEAKIIVADKDYYVIAYRGSNEDLYMKTVKIKKDGQIDNSVKESYKFASYGYRPDILKLSGDKFAIAYMGNSDDGFVSTFKIKKDGKIEKKTIDTIEFDTSNGAEPSIIKVSGEYYAVVYRGDDSYGNVSTIKIKHDGKIDNSVVDNWVFDSSAAYEPVIEEVDGNYFAVAYRGSENAGFIKTIEISNTGQIVYQEVDTLEFETSSCYDPSIIQISTESYGVAYLGPDGDGFLKTIEISSQSGQIANSVNSTFEFDAADGGRPDIINIDGTVYAVAYSGSGTDGFLKTLNVE